VADLKLLLTSHPEDLAARRLLAQSLRTLSRLPEAIDVLKEGQTLAPFDEPLNLQLADLFVAAEDYQAASELLNAQAARFPARGQTAHALARFLVSCPEPEFQNAQRALPLAQAVFAAQPTFEHTETLALALAANRQIDDAIALQKKLLDAALRQGAQSIADRLRENLKKFEQQRAAP
jgi:hypothetical protein